MKDDEQTENVQLRRNIINVAADIHVIKVTLQQAGVSEEVCDLFKAAFFQLTKACAFVDEYCPKKCKITPDELQREVKAAMQESNSKFADVCALNVFERQQLPSSAPSALVAIDEGDSDEGRGEDDVMDDESSCEFSETESYAQVDDSNEVLDFVDLKKHLLVEHQNLVERVEDEFDASLATEAEQQGGLEYRLMFGPYDIWSPMIIASSDFSQNKSSVLELEKQLIAFFVLLQDRMAASVHAKIAQRKMILKKLKSEVKASNLVSIDINVSATTASCTLSALDRAEEELSEGDDDDEDIDHYSVAAELAAEEADITNWAKTAMLREPMIFLIRKLVLQKIMCAVFQLIPFRDIILSDRKLRGEDVDRTYAFLDQIMPGWRESSKSCAEIWDDFICPLLQAGASDADVKEAYRLALILSQKLSSQAFEEYFAKAEAVFLNQLMEGCNLDQCLQRFEENGLQSYFLPENENLGRNRRLSAARSFILPTTFMTAVHRIQDRIQGNAVFSRSVYGVHCLAHSCFAKKDYKLLSSEKLIDPQPEDDESILNLVNKLLKLGDSALATFAADHLVLDLTTDINNNTENSLGHLKEFFGLCISSP